MSVPVTRTPALTISMQRRHRAHRRVMFRHLKRNYIAQALDGGLFLIGTSFISVSVILPKMIESLGAPDMAIAFTPTLGFIGFMLAPMFTAHYMEHLKRHKPLLMLTGIFQRLPYIVTALLFMFRGDNLGPYGWTLPLLCPLISSLMGGIGVTAWQELLANTIPVEKRSSLLALRNGISVISGVLTGLAASRILEIWPGTFGYGLLHLICFLFLTLSYGAFGSIRETPNPRPPATQRVGLLSSLSQMGQLVRAERAFRLYLVELLLGTTNGIILPFLTIYTLAQLNRGDSFTGILSSIQMAGGIIGSALAARIGDRHSPKATLLLSHTCWLALCIWLLMASTTPEFICIFFMSGVATFLRATGSQAMTLELIPLDNRIRYLTVISITNLIGILIVPFVSSGIWSIQKGTITYLALTMIAIRIVSIGVLRALPSPQRPDRAMGAE